MTDFQIHETKAAVSRMKNGETRMVVGTVSGGGKDYRFCAARTYWFDGQPERPTAVSFRAYLTGKPINAPGSLQKQKAAILTSSEVLAALVKGAPLS